MSSREDRHHYKHSKKSKRSDYHKDHRTSDKSGEERRERKRGREKEREKRVRSRSSSPKTKTDEKSDSLQSENIPGYDTMTAAERLKAKVKLLIDKSETTPTHRPDIGQVHQIEQDDFTPQQFVSKRKDRHKDEEETIPVNHDNAIFGKSTSSTTETQPTLRLPLIMKALEVPVIDNSSYSTQERAQKWADKLKLLRTKHSGNLK